MNSKQIKTNYPALLTLVTVFFFWGFVAASNGILIPFCKHHFSLSNFESQLLGSAFFGAYFLGSLFLYLGSSFLKYDIVNKIGYKKTIIIGLFISIIGALIMIPSTNANSFDLILCSLFIIALGFSLQQTAAQPFAISLGDESTGAHRLNFAGGINSLGTTVGPIIVSYFLFGNLTSKLEPSPSNINTLYLILAGVFMFVALIFTFSKLPSGKNDDPIENSPKASKTLIAITISILGLIALGNETSITKELLLSLLLVSIIGILIYSKSQAVKVPEGWGAMKYPQLIYGMIAIFIYVGVEVSIDNNFGALLKTPGYLTKIGLKDNEISKYISLYWGSLMIGRWIGAISVFQLSKISKLIATIIVPFCAFGIVLYANSLKGTDVSDLYNYAIVIVIGIIAFLLAKEKPVRTMAIVSTLAIFSMLIGVFTTGLVSIYAFISGGLFCSVMWPCIFALSVTGLGKHTSQGSAFLITMILGGAIIPPFQGAIGDTWGIHFSYIIAAACFAVLLILTLLIKKSLTEQNINVDNIEAEGGH